MWALPPLQGVDGDERPEMANEHQDAEDDLAERGEPWGDPR